jgi:hypothetical protein
MTVISFTTPACTAYFNIYCSTAAALVSFVVVVSLIMLYRPSINSGVFVYSCHVFADSA